MAGTNGSILTTDPETGGMRSFAVDDGDLDDQLEARTRPSGIVAG